MSLDNCKSKVRYHYTVVRTVKTQNTTTTKAGKNVEQQELSYIVGRNAKWYSHFGRQIGSFL